MVEQKPLSTTRLALILLAIFACLLCAIFGMLAALAGSLSDPYAAIRTSLAENNLLTPVTAGPTTTPGPTITNTLSSTLALKSSATMAIFSTAGKLPSSTASTTLTASRIASQSGTPTLQQTLSETPSPSKTTVQAATTSPTATQTPTPTHTASATVLSGGNCVCVVYPEGNPRNLNCTTTSFATVEEAQACYERCGGPNNDIYGLDSDHDGQACEDGLSTPSPTPTTGVGV